MLYNKYYKMKSIKIKNVQKYSLLDDAFSKQDLAEGVKVILSKKITMSRITSQFEKEFATFAGTQYAVALTNGTVALDVALKALGIGSGDDVIVTSRTFLASASSIVTAGANPVFADVELDSQNISRRTIEAVLTPNTKAIICVHLAGWMCDVLDAIGKDNEVAVKTATIAKVTAVCARFPVYAD
jgi:dTDP-4-amino-4,6-dideoxygalactose transaminase